MIKAMPDAATIWQDPYEMLIEWDISPSKIKQELFVAEYVGECGKLVDLGCGNGRYAKVMNYYSYVGYDGSFMMIADARRRNPDIDFALLDIFNFQSDELYDTVIMIDVAIHQIDPIEAVRTILKNWYTKRYFFTILAGEVREELLNSVVVSNEELQNFLHGLTSRMHIEPVLNESFTWNLIEIIKEH